MPQDRKKQRVSVHTEQRDDDEGQEEEESSSGSEGEGQPEEEEEEEDQPEQQGEEEQSRGGKKVLKIPLKKAPDVCKVCGQRGHSAGFQGSVYIDCILKPCYLCKLPGHTTATCPYRIISPGFGLRPANKGLHLTKSLAMREVSPSSKGSQQVVPQRVPNYQVTAAILKLHSRRCTALEYHPHNPNVVISADKKGGLAAWDFTKVKERTLYSDVHKYLVGGMSHVPWLEDTTFATASSDGTSKLLDLETGLHSQMIDLNPMGYISEKEWKMVQSVAVSSDLKAILVGDSDGNVHVLDPRQKKSVATLQLHKKGNKVTSLGIHPLEPRLIATSSNDHSVRLFDIRGFSSLGSSSTTASSTAEAGPSSTAGGASSTQQQKRPRGGGKHVAHSAELACLPHPRVVNAVAFSPHTGRRLLTTCQDNRLRVWDSALSACSSEAPSREIVHSHDFNRYLSPFRAEWDPKDATESTFIIGRYISEDHGGVALHAVDIISAADGSFKAQLFDHNMSTISPVNKPHPTRDYIVSGSSRSLFLWSPVDDEEEGENVQEPRPSAAGAAESSHAFDQRSRGQQRRSVAFQLYDADPDSEKKGKKGKGKGNKGSDSE